MKLSIALLAFFPCAMSQSRYLDTPQLLWTASLSPVGQGNECTFAPNSPILVCSSSDGIVTAFDTQSSTVSAPVWIYNPDSTNVPSSTSGITFSSTGISFVYGVTETSTSIKWYVIIL
jgi:hypothetical protein